LIERQTAADKEKKMPQREKEMYSCGEVLEVEYHDEIHEQLHRIAHVDYTKPIIRNGKCINLDSDL
jgi:acetyl-CoA carboxylase beta subunit